MLDKLKSFFLADDPDRADTAAGDAREMAAAILLYEAAASDGEIAAQEDQQIRTLLKQRFDLDEAAASELCATARDKQAQSVEISSFTRALKTDFDQQERIEMVEMLWEVVYADGLLDDFEANLLRRVGGLLYVTDQENGAARKRVVRKMGLKD